MNCLIIPCYIRTDWDLACLHRLLDSIDAQSLKLERVYVVDDASPLKYGLKDRKITGYFVMKDDRNQFYFENVGKNYQTAFIHMNVFSDSRVCLNDVLCNK